MSAEAVTRKKCAKQKCSKQIPILNLVTKFQLGNVCLPNLVTKLQLGNPGSGLGHQSVIPANAGIQAAMDSRIRGNDGDGFVTKAGTADKLRLSLQFCVPP
jgi:hypothetical protein